jgi:RNA polymerase sigma-70 factor (ECF subfamily)
MLGSVDEAEDLVQETYLRAWRSFGSFEGRTSLRNWLYKIATNTCLTAIGRRDRRPLPSGLHAPSNDPDLPPAPAPPGQSWVQPIPDVLLRTESNDPASIVESRGSVRLALVAAMQHLPARQRAVLILRDVLEFSAAEVVELLGTTPAAVNSALQRARSTLTTAAAVEEELAEPTEPRCRDLLDRYVAAFENADLGALPDLLSEDAVVEMPPSPTWFIGRAAILRFLAGQCFGSPGINRMVPIRANGQLAVAAYQRGPDGMYHAQSVQVFTVVGDRIARIVAFFDVGLFPMFGLALTIEPGVGAAAKADR